MIIVTGASGKLGRAIVEKLLARVPADRIGASVREPESAAALAAKGVRVRKGDFARPETLAEAFEGASQVLIVSSNARAHGGDTIAQHRDAIDAARKAGVGRIVYTSQFASSASSEFAPARDHAATEELLGQAGVPWTSLRNGFYASSGIDMLGNGLETGVIDSPAEGKVAWTAHDDLAEAAAVILAGEARFDGPTPPLTASESLDFADLGSIAADILGKPIRRQIVEDDAFKERLVARKVPPVFVEIALGYYRASRNGEFARVDPTLEKLIGRKPTSMRDFMISNLKRSTKVLN